MTAVFYDQAPLVHLQQTSATWTKSKRTFGGRLLTGEDDPTLTWQWETKLNNLSTEGRWLECFSIVFANDVQGFIAMTQPTLCKIGENASSTALCVEYLEVAPWNRRDLLEQPRLSGVGAALITAAAQRSVELGHEGRIVLHSIPSAAGFYHRLGFHAVDKRAGDPVIRYELTTVGAQRLLNPD